MTQRKQQVLALLKSIETGDPQPVAFLNSDKYIQHNLGVGDGLAGLGAVLAQLPAGSAKVNTVRVFADGEFVFAHTDYNFFGPKVGFDVFRFEDDFIVEHWDNLQETPAAPNPSGHTMLDGPVEVTDLQLTEQNKGLVHDFISRVLVKGQLDAIPSFIDGENYTQHNPQIGDGLSGLSQALAAMAAQGISMTYSRIHRILGEGSFVLAMSEGHFANQHVSFYDLFRIDNGKLVEHWDTIEVIPPPESWKNQNGKF